MQRIVPMAPASFSLETSTALFAGLRFVMGTRSSNRRRVPFASRIRVSMDCTATGRIIMSRKRLSRSFFFGALAFAFGAGDALAASPTITDDDDTTEQPVPGILTGAAPTQAPLLRSTDPGAQRFVPVGKLLTGAGNYHCTASLIAGTVTPPPNSPALILTAGHCVNDNMTANEVMIDQPAGSEWSYTPAYFIDTPAQHIPVAVDRVVYATMKGSDLAVLQLSATYGQLAARGINPLRLERAAAVPNTPIELVHVPVMGVPVEEQFLRRSVCHTQTGATPLFESYFPWFWTATVPNDCEGVAGGTSGSPVFNLGYAAIVGVLNTTVTPDFTGCGLGRPCEPTDTGDFSREQASYSITVDRIVDALKDDGTLDVSQLDPGHGVTLTRVNSPAWSTQRNQTIDDTLVPARWNLRINDGFDLVFYKVGQANAIDCASINGYQGPFLAADQPLIALQTPSQEGVYAVCVVGQAAGSGTWQPYEYATVELRQIDETPPNYAPSVNERSTGDRIDVMPLFSQFELIDLYVKYGPLEQTDCQKPLDYQRYRRNQWISFDRQQASRFCAYGVDLAENAGPPLTKDYVP
jgi:Trypsin-like peptidase domain